MAERNSRVGVPKSESELESSELDSDEDDSGKWERNQRLNRHIRIDNPYSM